MKGGEALNASDFEQAAQKAVIDLLARVGSATASEPPKAATDGAIDFVINVEEGNRRHVLLVECKAGGQPRQIREALLQLRFYADQQRAVPLLVAYSG